MKITTLLALIVFASMSGARAGVRAIDESANVADLGSFAQTMSLEKVRDSSGQSYFDRLESMYDKGAATQVNEVLGWYLGRCYMGTKPNIPIAAVLIGFVDDNGPAFPPAQFKVFAGTAVTKPADYFDAFDAAKEKELNDYLSSYRHNLLEAYMRGNALVGGSTVNGTRWSMRSFQNYTVLQAFYLGQIQAYCYYFAKLK